ncbi:hypothetical protein EJ05DRAFT_483937 [Pseudovirgaria hyperparasitica]|uniref:Uncharacterized protein n=1 Tax=Pseudovirgaria hyperparasitica TaxID=470096 RepID=A0A6A6WBF1_9PEZI|nr:uncharacterized protein EJ05DRAFT_483937 [Pseudovirgaria hyperparasitica]KAF2760162.1 hypothetical protein EJ05DRAFT_483937 [Pseudovirgaria hyperparasitica]
MDIPKMPYMTDVPDPLQKYKVSKEVAEATSGHLPDWTFSASALILEHEHLYRLKEPEIVDLNHPHDGCEPFKLFLPAQLWRSRYHLAAVCKVSEAEFERIISHKSSLLILRELEEVLEGPGKPGTPVAVQQYERGEEIGPMQNSHLHRRNVAVLLFFVNKTTGSMMAPNPTTLKSAEHFGRCIVRLTELYQQDHHDISFLRKRVISTDTARGICAHVMTHMLTRKTSDRAAWENLEIAREQRRQG